MIRLFVGVELPDDVRAQVAALGGGVPGARWIPPESFHITVRFIGEVDEGMAEDIDAALAGIRAAPFEISLAGIGAFGKDHQARTLMVPVADSPALATLHEKVDRAMQRVGLGPERRKFLPHVTLARLRAAPLDRVERFKADHAMFRAGPFVVGRFALFSSLLSRNGAIYRSEAEYPLWVA